MEVHPPPFKVSMNGCYEPDTLRLSAVNFVQILGGPLGKLWHCDTRTVTLTLTPPAGPIVAKMRIAPVPPIQTEDILWFPLQTISHGIQCVIIDARIS